MIAGKRTFGIMLAAAVLAGRPALDASEAFELALWPGAPPGSERSTLKEAYKDRPISDGTATPRDRSIEGVTKPTVTVYLPDEARRSGAAVLICPGGGFNRLAIDKEGHDVARWLSGQGIAAMVLKYRLPDPGAGLFVRNGAVKDMHRAIRLVRRRAREWNIAPDRVGVMGFSAGGYLAALSGTLFDKGNPKAEDPIERESCRPDFITPVYPLISLLQHAPGSPQRIASMLGPGATEAMLEEYSPDRRVKAGAPHAFLVHACDDNLPAEHSIHFYLGLRQAGVPAELHVYAVGGHGFGIRARGLPVSSWKDRWLQWLRTEGFVK